MKGTVKFFNRTKGFGFISGEDGKDYFVHHTGLKEGTSIDENDSVEFDAEQGDRGPKAVNVRMSEGGSDDSSEEMSEDFGSDEDDDSESSDSLADDDFGVDTDEDDE